MLKKNYILLIFTIHSNNQSYELVEKFKEVFVRFMVMTNSEAIFNQYLKRLYIKRVYTLSNISSILRVKSLCQVIRVIKLLVDKYRN